jgi:hypothetical protein
MHRVTVLLFASALLSGCSVTAGALAETSVLGPHPSTAAGLRVDWHTRRLSTSAEGLTLGLRFDHLFQLDPGTTYDRSRWEGLVGFSVVPRGYRRRVGVDLLARVGAARGALGGALPTPIALSAGATLGMPIQLNAPDFGDDEVLRFTVMLVPFADVGLLYAPDLGAQLVVGGGLGLRVHFDSALLP